MHCQYKINAVVGCVVEVNRKLGRLIHQVPGRQNFQIGVLQDARRGYCFVGAQFPASRFFPENVRALGNKQIRRGHWKSIQQSRGDSGIHFVNDPLDCHAGINNEPFHRS